MEKEKDFRFEFKDEETLVVVEPPDENGEVKFLALGNWEGTESRTTISELKDFVDLLNCFILDSETVQEV